MGTGGGNRDGDGERKYLEKNSTERTVIKSIAILMIDSKTKCKISSGNKHDGNYDHKIKTCLKLLKIFDRLLMFNHESAQSRP